MLSRSAKPAGSRARIGTSPVPTSRAGGSPARGEGDGAGYLRVAAPTAVGAEEASPLAASASASGLCAGFGRGQQTQQTPGSGPPDLGQVRPPYPSGDGFLGQRTVRRRRDGRCDRWVWTDRVGAWAGSPTLPYRGGAITHRHVKATTWAPLTASEKRLRNLFSRHKIASTANKPKRDRRARGWYGQAETRCRVRCWRSGGA